MGAGIKNVYESTKLMSDVLPKECHHYKHQVEEFDPEANQVTLSNGKVVRQICPVAMYTNVYTLYIIVCNRHMLCLHFQLYSLEGSLLL